jgi:threonine dehydrogenase-like Zn-dependent dehydrogenase
VDSSWQDARVFCFHPHCGYFTAKPESLILLPDDVSFTAAVMTPNMETAVNFLMDGRPVIGENVAVVGLGIVGLLTVMLSSRMSPASLGCIEPHPVRAEAARSLGADFVVDSVSEATERYNGELALRGLPEYADLVYELSGNPPALNTAIGIAGFSARVIVGSWYGAKRAALDLGGRFHRERIRVLSSQVSTLDPRFVGRWTNRRRLATALRMLAIHPVESLVTHRFHVDHAHDAYRLLDQNPGAAIQVIFTYEDCT